ncbi:hypothetical protein [Micromonospora sp. NBC_01412]|uniref:hypothetical protein n=1 Tax=Micromonospora sp. NBC_01412 TaxID=2903590 RepID=UPI00324AC7E6
MNESEPWPGPRRAGNEDGSNGSSPAPDDVAGEARDSASFADAEGWRGGVEDGSAGLPADPTEVGEPDDADLTDEPEEALDPEDVLARLASLLGPASAIDVGDVRVRGQNATGPGATAIGTQLNITTARTEDGLSWTETRSGTWVRQLADGYAHTPSDPELDRNLKQRHLVCLSAAEGTGRHTAAYLASARRHDFDRVALLHAEQPADLLRRDALLREGHGYVWPLSEAVVRQLDGMALVGLAARAEATGATLILVGDFGRRDHEFAGHLVEHRSAAAADVFRAQLRRHLRGRCVGSCGPGCAGDCVDEYVDEECVVHPLLAAHLAGSSRPGEVVHLAQLLARFVPRDVELTERLERLLPRQLRERAARVLAADDGGDAIAWGADRRRAFRLSCAVLAGQPVAEIHAAAGALAAPGLGGAGLWLSPAGDTAQGLSSPGGGVPGFPVADGGPPGLLTGAGAGGVLDTLLGPVLRQAVLLVGDDRAPGGRRIEFAPGNDQLRASLLEVAWTDWWLPEQLLGWLADLVRDGTPGVRQAAAGAISWSAVHGVHAALRTVDQLARERRAGVRQAAAIALVGMAMQPELRRRVRVELDGWAAGGAAHLRDTVARAYASGLAWLWPETALVQLRRVAEARMQRWHNSVVRGLEEVYVAGHAASVLPALAEWATADDPEVRLHAGRALRVLADRWAPAPREHWPELLDLVGAGTVELRDLATCWATALCLPGTAYRAWRTLGFWLSRADGHPEVAAYCRRLLDLVVAGREPLRHRLDHQLRYVWGPLMPGNALLNDVRRLIDEDPT